MSNQPDEIKSTGAEIPEANGIARPSASETTGGLRPEYDVALDIVGFVRDRVVAGDSMDRESIRRGLDGAVPGWAERSHIALRDAVHLAFSERDHARRSCGALERKRCEQTLITVAGLYTESRGRSFINP